MRKIKDNVGAIVSEQAHKSETIILHSCFST